MWDRLRNHAATLADRRIADTLTPARAAAFSVEADDMRFDYARTSMDETARDMLVALFDARGVAARREAMFSGAKINETEGRAVLHTALRNPGTGVMVDGRDVMPEVHETLARMETFARAVRSGDFAGAGGTIRDVVNIGIGGSDLGPAMAVRALAPYHDGPRCHFVSNIDPADIATVLDACDPATTLAIVASKTFTTVETMTNAATARDWLAKGVADPAAQLAALSSASGRTDAWGIDPARVFGFEDWVGGRYSVWGPIGLSLMIAIGPERFREFLAGGHAMDRHFRTAPWRQNMPAMLAAVGLWHNQVLGHATRAVLPYDERLGRLPAYLQQLEMESNGKRVSMDGAPLAWDSGPVVWGEPGTNGQHAFYQLIHQGTRVIPCEFLVAARGHDEGLHHQHRLLVANCLAQAEALTRGRSLDEARAIMAARGLEGAELERQAAHRVFPGNRPSTLLSYPRLDPFTLGRIIALYEHRVFVEGVVVGINSFDQWGVELGKELATALAPVIEGTADAQGRDGATQASVAWLRRHGV
ncbi:MAG: glucose-6-phosphate isomerase [Rubellimicrobium sp.]|nr:glucose-6-phosphate isomerase [Rubellimicrobium sp.]